MAMATAAQGAIGLVGGAAKFFEGRKMQQEANKNIAAFKWDELQNVGESLQVSTLGSDLAVEENARNTATAVDSLRGGGNRALVGGLGRIMSQSDNVARKAGADLDMQQKEIDKITANDSVRIRDMKETRQTDELAGYGAQLNAGMDLKQQGISNVMNAVGTIGQGASGLLDGGIKAAAPAPAATATEAANPKGGSNASGMNYGMGGRQ